MEGGFSLVLWALLTCCLRMGARNQRFVGLHDARHQYLAASPYNRKVRVNVFAVIVELGFSKPSTGTDHCLNLRLIDQTHNEVAMTVNIFTENAVILHHHAAPGHIIRLTQVIVDPYNQDLTLVFNKKMSSFAFYKGKDDNTFDPYQVSSKFIPGAEDHRFIAELRRWLVSFQFREDPSKFPMLREIKDGSFGLACKILNCWEVTEDKWGFFVWDGTDAPPNAISAKLEDEINSPLPLTLAPLSLPRELLCTFPDVGTILLIIVNPKLVKTQLDVLNSGKWVKFVNMHFEVDGGLWCGKFTPRTKLRYTPNEDTLVIERLRLYEERKSLQSGRVPFSCSWPNSLSVTENTNASVRPMTLMGILADSKVTAKYRCLVRVVAAMPCQAEMLPCPDDGIYKLLLTLEDPTARIRAHVFEKDGETFFDGYPSNDVLTRKLNRLLGVAEGDGNMGVQDTPRNPPWLSVCIKAFYKVKTDPWGTRSYRIFDTKIVGET